MKTVLIVGLFCIGTLLAGEQLVDSTINGQNAFTFYRSFTRLTKKPHSVSPITAVLCAPIVADPKKLAEQEKEITGPHYQALVHLYANQLAAGTISRKQKSFPEGSIIVKEKLGDGGSVTAIGGMVKRAPGFDAEHGDWEYFYASKPDGFTTGHLQNCIQCHGQLKNTDCVYSVWDLSK